MLSVYKTVLMRVKYDGSTVEWLHVYRYQI